MPRFIPRRGESLATLLSRDGRLDLLQIRELGARLAAAVVTLRELGIPHRAITPAHVVITDGRVELRGAPPVDPALAADEAQDAYSLGCLAYEMATGRPPTGSPPPLARAIEPDLPAPLEALLARLLDEDPEQRPTLRYTAAAFRALPDALPGGLDAVSLPDWRRAADPNRNPWGTFRRHTSIAVIAAIAVALAIVALLVVSAWS